MFADHGPPHNLVHDFGDEMHDLIFENLARCLIKIKLALLSEGKLYSRIISEIVLHLSISSISYIS